MSFDIKDIKRLQQFAGIIVESSHDNEDDLTPAERELVKKAESDLAKKGIKVKDVDPEKDLEALAKKEEKVGKKEPEKAEKAEKAAAEEAKKKGRKQSERAGAMLAWLQANKNATRKEFITHAMDKHGMSQHHANTLFYSLKNKLMEYYVVMQPFNGRVIAEHSSADRPQWVQFDNIWAQDAMIFESEVQATEMVIKLIKQGWDSTVKKITVKAVDGE